MPEAFDPASAAPKRNSTNQESGRISSPRYLLPNMALLMPAVEGRSKTRSFLKNPGAYPLPSRMSRDMRKSASPKRVPPKGVLTMSFSDGGWISANCSQTYEPKNAYAKDS